MANHDLRTGEIDDEPVLDGEVIDPISIGALATLQRVEIDQQVATAKAYPRNVPMIKKELTALVTMDEETADDCIYALPRGNKHIKGPSARFADALISFWGNARSGAFITQVNREEKFVEAIGSFQDVERNVIRQRCVRRPIAERDGRIYNGDMINMTGNAACVIAERNAILNGIPKSLWSGAYEQAFALVAGTTKTLGEKLARAEKAFALMGISMEQVLEKIGASDLSKVVPDDIVTMRGMLTALKTGEETVETIFGRGAGAPSHEVVKSPLKDDPISSGKSAGGDRKVDSGGKSASKSLEEKGDAGGDQSETALTNRTPAEQAAPEAAESSAGAAGVETQASETNAPATSQAPETSQPDAPERPYSDAVGYMTFMRDQFDAAKGRSAVTDLWGATRSDRNELLDADQIEDLTKDKEAKLKALKLKDAGK